jgi:hypothetical protein
MDKSHCFGHHIEEVAPIDMSCVYFKVDENRFYHPLAVLCFVKNCYCKRSIEYPSLIKEEKMYWRKKAQ